MTAVVFDGIVFAIQKQGGVGRYFQEIASRHLRHAADARLVVFGDASRLAAVHETQVQQRPLRTLERYRRFAGPANGEVFHSSYYRLPAKRVPVVTTVHDFIYEKFRSGPAKLVHTRQKQSAIHNADAVICVSETTKRDLLDLCPGVPETRVTVVPNGASDVFLKSCNRRVSDPPYALFVGSRGPAYKNFEVAAEAVKLLPGLLLIAVGPPPTEDERRRLREAEGQFQFQSVDDEGLRALYEGAVCLVYPSLYEGFGLPIVEALACRCPVVCLAAPGVEETAGSEGYFASENTPASFAEAMRFAMKDPNGSARGESGAARARRLSWDRSYELTNNVYRSLGGK